MKAGQISGRNRSCANSLSISLQYLLCINTRLTPTNTKLTLPLYVTGDRKHGESQLKLHYHARPLETRPGLRSKTESWQHPTSGQSSSPICETRASYCPVLDRKPPTDRVEICVLESGDRWMVHWLLNRYDRSTDFLSTARQR